MLHTHEKTETSFILAFQSLIKQAVHEALKDAPKTEPVKDDKAPATRQAAANYLNISLPTVDTLIRTGQLRSFNIGRQIRIPWEELERFSKGDLD